MPQITVIIPIYNGAKFIADTINSVLGQTFGDFELLLINDGSKDNSAEVCEKYVKLDSRVKLINQDNAGASIARLTGIKSSNSDWITFLDQDDLLEDFALSTFNASIEKNIDLIISDCNKVISGSKAYVKLILTSAIPVTNWGKLFRRTILKDFIFQDARTIRLGDDTIINFRIGMVNPDLRIKCINDKLYKYSIGLNQESMSNAFRRTEDYEQHFYTTLTNGFDSLQLQPFINELIKIRLNALKYIIIDNGYKLNDNSDFVKNLKNDIKQSHYIPNFTDNSALNNVYIFRFLVFLHSLTSFLRRQFLND